MKRESISNDTRYFIPPTKIRNPNNEECLVCAENILIYAHYTCNHYCCYLCALRMRKIGDLSCPVCRSSSVTLRLSMSSNMNNSTRMNFHKKTGLFYATDEILDHVHDLDMYRCPQAICWEDPGSIFDSIHLLKDHLYHKHGESYCDVCIESKPCFLIQQNLFDGKSLNLHIKGEFSGDLAAFLGHIYCHFCRKYMYDAEEFVRHMRTSHFACDLCSQVWPNRYFVDRRQLYKHFKAEHFICEHPDCSREDLVTKAFSSEIELISHSISAHKTKSSKKISVNPKHMGFQFTYTSPQSINMLLQHMSFDDMRLYMITFDFLNFQKKINLQKYTQLPRIIDTATSYTLSGNNLSQNLHASINSETTGHLGDHSKLPKFGSATRYKKVVMSGDKHRQFTSSKILRGVKNVSPNVVSPSNERIALTQEETDSAVKLTNEANESTCIGYGANCRTMEDKFPSLGDSYNTPTLKLRKGTVNTQATRCFSLRKAKLSVWESKDSSATKLQNNRKKK